MESHIRVYIQANWDALMHLPCAAYKVLMALVARGDNVGRSFPSAERIADDTGLHPSTVYSALNQLEQARYIGFLRRNEYDPVIGRKMPNVYQVTPHFMTIAVECQPEALEIWKSLYPSMPLPMPHILASDSINQQQEPAFKNQPKVTSTRKQQQQQTYSTEGETAKTDKPQTAKNNRENADGESTGVALQRSEKSKSSAIVKNYTNPDSIAAPLPDGLQECLAERVNGFGIPIMLARGLVSAHGYEAVHIACNQLDATRARQTIDNPGGFLRYLLQNRILDDRLPELMKPKKRDYSLEEYDEFFES